MRAEGPLRRRQLRRVLGGLLVTLLLGSGVLASAAVPAEAQLSLALSRGEAKVGERVIVRLEGWASASVTLHVCGNLGLRGAPDCDVTGGQGVGMNRSGPTLTELRVSAPPVTCPCVVRASSSTGSEIQTASLSITGVPVGPIVRPGPPPALLTVSTTVSSDPQGLVGTVRALLGGRSHHRMTILLQNTSDATLSKVFLAVAVGRTVEDSHPVPVPAVEALKPGEARTYEVPVILAAPRWGRYLWLVTAEGAGPRVGAQTESLAVPWVLYLLLALLALDVVVIAMRKLQRTLGPRPPKFRSRRTGGGATGVEDRTSSAA